MLIDDTLDKIRDVYKKDDRPWTIGYSGGKDSSVVLKLCFNAIKAKSFAKKQINVVYCDTGVEIPFLSTYVYKTLKTFEKESKEHDLPFKIKIVKPELNDRFFVKVIGRGYVTPTNKFRWCTRRLRINPLQKTIKRVNEKNLVLLGVRNNESFERNKIIGSYRQGNTNFLRQDNVIGCDIFSPIIDYSTDEVWDVIKKLEYPISINFTELQNIYQIVESTTRVDKNEMINSRNIRFGCWVCTVVRKDRAMMKLVECGYDNLIPLLNFRNWLVEIRDNPSFRSRNRRNGCKGKGPFTIKARKLIFEKLKNTEKASGFLLLPKEEERVIFNEWKKDLLDPSYKEL